MKTLFYILIAFVIGTTFTSCTTDSLTETEELYTNVLATEGEVGEIEEEDEGGGQ